MIWLVRSPWTMAVAAAVALILWGGAFWLYLGPYQRRYSPAKALQVAALRATLVVVWWGVSFGLVFALVSAFFPPGNWRYIVGSIAWWLVGTIAGELIWAPFQELLDRRL